MKKLVTIFLLGAMLLFSMGNYIVYRFNLKNIKQQMRLAIRQGEFSANELVSFSFDTSDPKAFAELEVKEQGKEIRYKGKMYDVVSAAWKDNKLVISCLADDDETHVIAGFSRFLDESNGVGKKALNTVKYSFPVFTIPQVADVDLATQEIKLEYSRYQSAFIPIPYLNKPSPPPWQA